MYFIDDVSDLADRISKNEILLCNAGECWVYILSASAQSLPEKLQQIQHPIENPAMLLVSNIEMFKLYVPEIHPRVETLLSLHKRPLGIYFDNSEGPFKDFIDEHVHIVRLAKDPLLVALIDKLNAPIIILDVMDENAHRPKRYSEIEPQLIDASDYTLQYRKEESLDPRPCIIASYDKKGELEFVRE